MRAVVELRKDVDPQKVLTYLYKYSDLQVTFGVNMVAIADGKPVQMGLKQMIRYYVDYQKKVVTRRTQYELNQAKARAHILEGLMIALDNLDEVIALIRASKSPKEAKAALMERFALSDIQAQAILDMRLQRLTNLEIEALRKEYADVLKLISRLEGILKSEKKLLGVIRSEMQEIADQYADDRRTALEDPSGGAGGNAGGGTHGGGCADLFHPQRVSEADFTGAAEEVSSSRAGGKSGGQSPIPASHNDGRNAVYHHKPRKLLSSVGVPSSGIPSAGPGSASVRRTG